MSKDVEVKGNELGQSPWRTRGRRNELSGKILAAASKLLVSDGLENLSMRRIAAEIGCKAPSIYYHYKNKDALIHALIDEGHRLLYEALIESEVVGISPLDNLENNLRAFVKFCLEQPVYYEIMYLMRSSEVATYPKELYRKARRTGEPGIRLLKAAEEDGLIKPADHYTEIVAMCYMLHGFITMVLTGRFDRSMDQEQMLEHILNRIFLWLGVGGEPGKRQPE